MIAFLFPGQGSQHRGMGQALFDEVQEYASLEKEVDRLLGYSLRRLCLDDPENRLQQTQYTQPCLYVVNALHYYKARAQGSIPTYVAGHSLGEYNALLAAGVYDFMTGLQIVRRRGELMAQVKNGGMAAVVGLTGPRIAQIISESRLTGLDLANFNTPLQSVISGPVAEIQRAGAVMEQAGAKLYMPLPVSGAFHSRYMADVAKAFNDYLTSVSFHPPKLPVIANVTALPYPADNPSNTIQSLLGRQITSSVKWTQTIQYLMDRGVTEFREMGPGNVLTRLVQQIRQQKAA